MLGNRGFTLLEVLIALAIMVISFGSILMVESNSINAAIRSRQMTVVSMLAKNAMVDTEMFIQGKTFREVKEEESGNFSKPYENYRWTRVVKEVEFPDLTSLIGGQSEQGVDRQTEILSRLVSQYLSDSIREVTVTVYWEKGKSTNEFSISTYWVNYGTQFRLTQ